MTEIKHLKCDVCGRDITYCEVIGEMEHFPFFQITRSNHDFICNELSEAEEIGEKKERMRRDICEKCFLNILHESKILGKMFFSKRDEMYLF